MKSIKLVDHIADSSLYFRNCYGILNEGIGKKSHVFFRGLDSDTVYLRTTEGEDKNLPFSKANKVTFPSVKAGFINVINDGELDRAVYLDRLPIRQFAWGFNTQSYKIHAIDKDVASKLFLMTPNMANKGVLKGAFDGSFPSAKNAIKKLEAGKALSVALDEHIALSYKWGGDNIQIFNHSMVVGEVVDGGFKLYEGAEHTSEAISKYLGKLIKE